jgi:hypothetical protein
MDWTGNEGEGLVLERRRWIELRNDGDGTNLGFGIGTGWDGMNGSL